MSKLSIIEYKNEKVLTTKQIAEAYGSDTRRISENYARNSDKYKLGKHYILLEGEEKREFCNHTQIADGQQNASKLYLWTEKGAWLHAKSLNTNRAWEAYEMLVDEYYRLKDQMHIPKTLPEALRLAADLAEQNQKLLSDNATMKPKAEFFDAVAGSTDAIDIGSAVKVLNMGIGRNKLFEILREEKILMQNNQPYQKYIDCGYFRTIEQKFYKPDGSISINIKTLVYQKGLNFIRGIVLNNKSA